MLLCRSNITSFQFDQLAKERKVIHVELRDDKKKEEEEEEVNVGEAGTNECAVPQP